jgi:hypothetical protein
MAAMGTASDQHHDHVRLLAGHKSDGQPVFEVLPAELVKPGVYDVLGSPGLAHGCAAGDRIQVNDDGSFEVLERGRNLCLVLYPTPPLHDHELASLGAVFQQLGGIVETPPTRRFIVVTVPVTAGFDAVEHAASSWASTNNAAWEYGNVYDDHGNALGWWTTA